MLKRGRCFAFVARAFQSLQNGAGNVPTFFLWKKLTLRFMEIDPVNQAIFFILEPMNKE